MKNHETEFGDGNLIELLDRKAKAEKWRRVEIVAMTIIPIFIIYIFTSSIDRSLSSYNSTITAQADSLATAKRIIHELFIVNDSTIKHVKQTDPKVGHILQEVRNEPYQQHRNSPDIENDSPLFLSRLFAKYSMVKRGNGGLFSLEADMEEVPIENPFYPTEDCETGDVIIYRSGYAMLYVAEKRYILNDHWSTLKLGYDRIFRTDFVIGFTSFGIIALNPRFDTIEKILRPDYSKMNSKLSYIHPNQ